MKSVFREPVVNEIVYTESKLINEQKHERACVEFPVDVLFCYLFLISLCCISIDAFDFERISNSKSILSFV